MYRIYYHNINNIHDKIELNYYHFPYEIFQGPDAIIFPKNTELHIVSLDQCPDIRTVLDNLQFFSFQQGIKKLHFTHITVNSMLGIENLPHLNTLILEDVKNLNGIEFCSELQNLTISSKKEPYISSLCQLANLPLSSLFTHGNAFQGIGADEKFTLSCLDYLVTDTKELDKMVGRVSMPELRRVEIFVNGTIIDQYVGKGDYTDPTSEFDHRLDTYPPVTWLINQTRLKNPEIRLIFHKVLGYLLISKFIITWEDEF
jgi:hypothetical protein